MKVLKYWKMWNFEKFQLNWKLVKHFTRTKQWATFLKLLSLPQLPISPDKILLRLWNKTFLREIYRNIQTFDFKVLQGKCSWVSGNGAVQMLFLTPNRNMFAARFVNWESFLDVFWEPFNFNFKRLDILKMSVVFLSETVLWNEWYFSKIFISLEVFCYKFWNQKNSDAHWNV